MMRSASLIIVLASVTWAQKTPSLRQTLQKPLPLSLAPRMSVTQPLKVAVSQFGPNPLRARPLHPTSRVQAEKDDLGGIAKFFNPFGEDEDGKYNELDAFKDKEGTEYVTLFKMEKGVCKEATVAKGFKANIARATEGLLLGFEEGNCAAKGFKTASGDSIRSLPLLGDFVVTSFQSAKAYPDMGTSIVSSIAFLAGSVLTLVMARFHHNRSTMREEALLATCN